MERRMKQETIRTTRSCLLFHYSKVFDAKLSRNKNIIHCLNENNKIHCAKKEENVQNDERKCRLFKIVLLIIIRSFSTALRISYLKRNADNCKLEKINTAAFCIPFFLFYHFPFPFECKVFLLLKRM